MKIIACIQARLGSTRLPGKVLKKINGMPLLQHVYRRLLGCKEISEVVVAPGISGYNEINDFCVNHGLNIRNSWSENDNDLLFRFASLWRVCPFDAFLRVRADCLFIDPALMDHLVSSFKFNYPRSHAVSNWPRRLYSEGLDAEVWSAELLMAMHRTKECPREDFATWAIDNNKVVVGMQNPINEGLPHLSIDAQQDFDRAEKMLKILGNDEWSYEKTLEAYRSVMAEE